MDTSPLKDGLAELYGLQRILILIVPGIVTSKPEDLPDPCTCGKCGHKNGYVATGYLESSVANTAGGESCKNPITE